MYVLYDCKYLRNTHVTKLFITKLWSRQIQFFLSSCCLFSCIHGDGKVTRNFLYVSDVVDAFDVILHRGVPGSTYNIGTTFEISVIDLARYLIQQVRLWLAVLFQ